MTVVTHEIVFRLPIAFHCRICAFCRRNWRKPGNHLARVFDLGCDLYNNLARIFDLECDPYYRLAMLFGVACDYLII